MDMLPIAVQGTPPQAPAFAAGSASFDGAAASPFAQLFQQMGLGQQGAFPARFPGPQPAKAGQAPGQQPASLRPQTIEALSALLNLVQAEQGGLDTELTGILAQMQQGQGTGLQDGLQELEALLDLNPGKNEELLCGIKELIQQSQAVSEQQSSALAVASGLPEVSGGSRPEASSAATGFGPQDLAREEVVAASPRGALTAETTPTPGQASQGVRGDGAGAQMQKGEQRQAEGAVFSNLAPEEVSPVEEISSGEVKKTSFEAVALKGMQLPAEAPSSTGADKPADSGTGMQFSSAQVSGSSTPAPSRPDGGAQLRLPSGQVVAEAEVVDQVIGRFSYSRAGESSTMKMNLYPEELGQVKVELVFEKEGLRIHLQAQSQQVQEVLERHLPRLREAFEQQNVRLDSLQVSAEGKGDGGAGRFFEGRERSAWAKRFGKGQLTGEIVAAPTQIQSAGQAAARGISLRV